MAGTRSRNNDWSWTIGTYPLDLGLDAHKTTSSVVITLVLDQETGPQALPTLFLLLLLCLFLGLLLTDFQCRLLRCNDRVWWTSNVRTFLLTTSGRVKPNTHRRRRRDETRQFRLVGVGGVYWAWYWCGLWWLYVTWGWIGGLWTWLMLGNVTMYDVKPCLKEPAPSYKALSFLKRSLWNFSQLRIPMTIFCVQLPRRIFDLGPN